MRVDWSLVLDGAALPITSKVAPDFAGIVLAPTYDSKRMRSGLLSYHFQHSFRDVHDLSSDCVDLTLKGNSYAMVTEGCGSLLGPVRERAASYIYRLQISEQQQPFGSETSIHRPGQPRVDSSRDAPCLGIHVHAHINFYACCRVRRLQIDDAKLRAGLLAVM